jgi:hypothetical protein
MKPQRCQEVAKSFFLPALLGELFLFPEVEQLIIIICTLCSSNWVTKLADLGACENSHTPFLFCRKLLGIAEIPLIERAAFREQGKCCEREEEGGRERERLTRPASLHSKMP